MGQPEPQNQPTPKDPAEYSKMAMNAKTVSTSPTTAVQKLLAVGKNIVLNPDWHPKSDGTTFCNSAVANAAKQYGYLKLYDSKGNPLMANQIIAVLGRDPKWRKATATDAWDWALGGKLAVATFVKTPHGHVAVVSPGARVWSQKWSAYVPPVFNVGKADGMNLNPPYSVGENFAFLFRPVHYVYVA